MNPGGGSGWDEPPLDIQVPDDARELDRDVLAYHRELRAQRRRNRLRRLAGRPSRRTAASCRCWPASWPSAWWRARCCRWPRSARRRRPPSGRPGRPRRPRPPGRAAGSRRPTAAPTHRPRCQRPHLPGSAVPPALRPRPASPARPTVLAIGSPALTPAGGTATIVFRPTGVNRGGRYVTRWNRRLLFGALAMLVPVLAGCEAGLNAPTLTSTRPRSGPTRPRTASRSTTCSCWAPAQRAAAAGGQAGVFLALPPKTATGWSRSARRAPRLGEDLGRVGQPAGPGAGRPERPGARGGAHRAGQPARRR